MSVPGIIEPWHYIDLPNGETIEGVCDYRSPEAQERFMLPADLTGQKILDLGTYGGFWAIEAQKRGAREVVAMDRFDPPLEYTKKALDAYQINYFCSGDLDFPTSRLWDVYFDVVLFFGILYHLKNPYMGLWNAARYCKAGGMVLVETAVNQGKCAELPRDIPAMWVIDEVHHNDPTNYYVPNELAVFQLCRMAGLKPYGSTSLVAENQRLTVVCTK